MYSHDPSIDLDLCLLLHESQGPRGNIWRGGKENYLSTYSLELQSETSCGRINILHLKIDVQSTLRQVWGAVWVKDDHYLCRLDHWGQDPWPRCIFSIFDIYYSMNFWCFNLCTLGRIVVITKEYFPFSWGCDRWLASEHVCSREKPRRHYTSCELFLHIPLLKGRRSPFKIESSGFASSPFWQLSLGCSVSYSYGVVIWD